MLIIKKHSNAKIRKNIGQIFRKHNIIEYKSPEDYLSIDDFYKVYGYACFYKSDTEMTNTIKPDEFTITFVCSHYPRELIKHLQSERQIVLSKHTEGIYYLLGDYFPIQLILAPQLSEKENFWLHNLTNNLTTAEQANKLIKQYQPYKDDNLHQSIMNLIVNANYSLFKEEYTMCEALMELMKDEFAAREAAAEAHGIIQGETRGQNLKLLEQINKKLAKGNTPEEIADILEEEIETILSLMQEL